MEICLITLSKGTERTITEICTFVALQAKGGSSEEWKLLAIYVF